MFRRLALLLTIALSLSLSVVVLAAGAGTGVIKGQLVNGTAGAGVLGEQTVTLTTFLNDAETATASAKSDEGGRFTFSGLSIGQGYAYEMKVTYQEADYTSERITLTDNETERSVMLTVYESTSDASAISVEVGHTIIAPGEGGLEVMEYLVFTNPTDRSYIGTGEITTTGTRRTLKLPLPDKATDLQYGGDLMTCCVLQDAKGFYDTMAVLPGSKTIVYSYMLKNSSSSYAFSRDVEFPTSGYNLLVKGDGIQVSGSKLTNMGAVDMGGAVYTSLLGSDLTPGQTLDIQLSGLPKSSSGQAIMWVFAAVGVLGAGGGFAYLMMKKKGLQPVGVGADAGDIRQRLLLEIAKLDDEYETGSIQREVYDKRRAETKARLVGLMQGSKGRSSAE